MASEVLSTETKFTPSDEEWTAKTDDYGYCYGRPYVTVDDGRHTVCAVFTNDEGSKPVKHFVEKTHLIAAAPDLYEALKLALAAWGLEKSEPGFSLSAIEKQMRAALLKAHGGSSNEGE